MKVWKTMCAAVIALAVGSPAIARHYSHHYSRHYSHHAYGGSSSDYYTAASGHRVHRPMSARSAPQGATAQCRDHTWSFSESHRGTCSWHGGVARWL